MSPVGWKLVVEIKENYEKSKRVSFFACLGCVLEWRTVNESMGPKLALLVTGCVILDKLANNSDNCMSVVSSVQWGSCSISLMSLL